MSNRTPRLTGLVRVIPDAEDLYDELGAVLVAAAQKAVRDRGVFHLALSGGSTPEPFYMRLVTEPAFRPLPWADTHLWLVDERRVPLDDERSNYLMIRQALADHVPTPEDQKHPVPVEEEDPAAAYEHTLRQAMGKMDDQVPRLDFVLLGMGDDGHTASLFPHSKALRENDRLIALNDGRCVTPPPRVTMTYTLLNAARHLAVLVTGAKKAQTVRRIEAQLRNGPDPVELPITGIDPIDGTLTWYLDAAAAGL